MFQTRQRLQACYARVKRSTSTRLKVFYFLLVRVNAMNIPPFVFRDSSAGG
jgi:hypothetical protein